MKKIILVLFSLVIFVPSIFSQQKVTVTLDYGKEKKAETYQVNWYEGMTVLTALQKCATISTYPVKDYIFVTTINKVANIRGQKAWYYKVNNEHTGKLAYLLTVKPNDTIQWIYKKDVCSAIVDKK